VGVLQKIIHDNRFAPADVPKFEAKLFFEGSKQQAYLVRFGVLLFLSTIIATMGVIGDSTATVIGAMIIAPLMTPIMATTAALLTGQTARATRSTLLVVAAVSGVIVLSWLCGAFYLYMGRVISFETNTQITSRTTPTGVNLVAALASGAAGAFAMSRDDIADSLAGVAISISLVPPLCVVGIGLAGAEWSAALGAMLLFITNYLSILLAGGGLLALLGLGSAAATQIDGVERRNAYIAIAIATLVVAVPLTIIGARMAVQASEQQEAKSLTTTWLNGTSYTLDDIEINFVSGEIEISITGFGPPPSLSQLGPELEAVFENPVQINLDIIPADQKQYPAATPDPSGTTDSDQRN
jgi:uncharacterized hydrophobic protein (TIGR00271 family)